MAQICSPLAGIALEQLSDPGLFKNPFRPARAGDDGGHFGVDFSYWSNRNGEAMAGLPIQAVLAGRVAGVITDRDPYGNAVILETPLDQLPPSWLARLPIQEYDPEAPLLPALTLTCPAYDFTPPEGSLSLYLLYAHMLLPPAETPGEQAACGQEIGEVGSTGNSVNDHLHLETRIGPSGIQFASMAHYVNDATDEEMRTYCLWRISGAFQAFDPMALLAIP